MAELEAGGDLPGNGAEALAHGLHDRFQRLEAMAVPGGMYPGAFGGAVIDRMNTAARPSPVITARMSVPHISRTRSVVMVPCRARSDRPDPAGLTYP